MSQNSAEFDQHEQHHTPSVRHEKRAGTRIYTDQKNEGINMRAHASSMRPGSLLKD
ncbi:MAG: hypothetical protein ABIH80_02810 [Methanobacteriota archaeon]